MAYFDVATLSSDNDFILRCTAGYSIQAGVDPNNSPLWADQNRWALASTPGFGDAYAAAILNGVPNPGRDPSVISDAQINASIQAIGV